MAQSYVQTLVGLNASQTQLLTDYGVRIYQALTMLEPDDFKLILGTDPDTFIIRKRLEAMVKYFRGNNTMEASTTMQDVINASYHTPVTPVAADGGGVPAPVPLPVGLERARRDVDRGQHGG